MGQQDVHVLDRCDQVILDLLAPKPSPACAFEVMIVGGISKASFHEMVPAFSIPPGGVAVRLVPRYI